ncbi:MAG: family N-acetyltransferase [Solirubrobacterales bacterium]|nr:family N-acetyltransferase [Solirubrobacterales bacterium]
MTEAGAHAWIAEAHEAETVARLLIAFRDHYGRDWPSDDAFRAGVERLMGDPDTEFVLGATGPGAPAGGVVQLRFRFGLWRDGGDCLVEDVFVAEEARGGGVGRAMLEHATTRALERGCRRMELDTSEDNAPAIALYESLGFFNRAAAGQPRDLYFRRHLPHE